MIILINNHIKNNDYDENDDGVYIYPYSSLKISFTCYCTYDYIIMVNLKYA